jgi:hypothetical protein
MIAEQSLRQIRAADDAEADATRKMIMVTLACILLVQSIAAAAWVHFAIGAQGRASLPA